MAQSNNNNNSIFNAMWDLESGNGGGNAPNGNEENRGTGNQGNPIGNQANPNINTTCRVIKLLERQTYIQIAALVVASIHLLVFFLVWATARA